MHYATLSHLDVASCFLPHTRSLLTTLPLPPRTLCGDGGRCLVPTMSLAAFDAFATSDTFTGSDGLRICF